MALHPTFRKRMQAKGLEFPLPAGPLPVIMEDPHQHTVDFPICDDPGCCCHQLEQEDMQAEYQATQPKRRRSPRRLVEANCESPAPRGQGFRMLK